MRSPVCGVHPIGTEPFGVYFTTYALAVASATWHWIAACEQEVDAPANEHASAPSPINHPRVFVFMSRILFEAGSDALEGHLRAEPPLPRVLVRRGLAVVGVHLGLRVEGVRGARGVRVLDAR